MNEERWEARKVVIVGAGAVGSTFAYALAQSGLADEIALIDADQELAKGQVLDLVHGVLTLQERWLEPQAHREDEQEWIFLRFYDFGPDGALAFNVVTLRRNGGSGLSQRVATAPLWPLRRRELASALEIAGFGEIACWGDMQGRPFDPHTSGNLIVSARRKER